MTKLYYPDPLQALWMQKHFEMNIYLMGVEEVLLPCSDLEALAITVLSKYRHLPKWKYYIHPGQHHLFLAQVGDLVIKKGNIRLHDKIGTISHITKDKQIHLEADYHNDGGAHEGALIHITHISKVEIIQREGKAFFMPEREEE